jgi:hypothetical protein
MIRFFLIISYLYCIYALEPSCSSCKFYIQHKTNPQLGLCELFKEKGLNGVLIKNFATYCRSDENLCGKSGFLYEPKVEHYESSNINEYINEDKNVIDITDQLNNMCCGEVNEKSEIEDYENIERELFEVLQKIKRHNKKIFIEHRENFISYLENKNNIYNLVVQ